MLIFDLAKPKNDFYAIGEVYPAATLPANGCGLILDPSGNALYVDAGDNDSSDVLVFDLRPNDGGPRAGRARNTILANIHTSGNGVTSPLGVCQTQLALPCGDLHSLHFVRGAEELWLYSRTGDRVLVLDTRCGAVLKNPFCNTVKTVVNFGAVPLFDQKVGYKKNPQYAQFRPGEPHFDEFREIVVPDTAATQAAFISGRSSVLQVNSPDDVALVQKAKPDANLYGWVDANWGYLRPSYDYAPFKDFRVRKAISLAIDYAAISDGFYGPGWAYQASLNPGFPEAWKPDKVKTLPGYNPNTKAADRAEAAKLLTAAGFPNGKGIDFGLLYNRTTDLQVANTTRFQSQMGAVFPDMKVALAPVADSAAFAVRLAAGKFDMVAYTNTCVPDAVLELTSQYYSTGSRNYGHDNNKDVDGLLDRAIVELNKDARTKMIGEFQQRYMDEWMQSDVLMAQPKKFILQGNMGGYDKVVGPWFQYSSNAQAGRWYYVDK